jgi:hypothetical protein
VLTGESIKREEKKEKTFIDLIENNSIFIRKESFLILVSEFRAAISQGLIK